MKKRIYVAVILIITGVLSALAIDDGFYVIQSAVNRNYAIDNSGGRLGNGNNIYLWKTNGTKAQKWFVCNLPDGTCVIVSMCSNLNIYNITDTKSWYLLDLNASRTESGNNIHLWTFNDTKAQKWYITPNGDGSFVIRSSVNRDFVVDLRNSEIRDGNNIQIFKSNGTNAQKWYFAPTKP